MYRSHLHLGGALEEAGLTGQALERYERAAALAPEDPRLAALAAEAGEQVERAEEEAAAAAVVPVQQPPRTATATRSGAAVVVGDVNTSTAGSTMCTWRRGHGCGMTRTGRVG